MSNESDIDWDNNDFGDYYGLACDKIERLETERAEARRWARRMMRQRNELMDVASKLPGIIRRLEAENARLRAELAALKPDDPQP